MLFKFGKKIFDKIMDVMQPQFQDEAPVNVFDFWAGANFKLKIRNVEGYRNYDKSEFDKPSPLYSGDDKRLESLYATLYPLKDFIDPKNYKSYAELQKKLYDVLGNEAYPDKAAAIETEETASAPTIRSTGEVDQPSSAPARMPKSGPEEDEDEGGELSYFAKLARS
jgi:hypothetical protein